MASPGESHGFSDAPHYRILLYTYPFSDPYPFSARYFITAFSPTSIGMDETDNGNTTENDNFFYRGGNRI